MADVIRQPPSAIQAEQNVLGALMLRNQAFAEVADWLSVDDFYREDHRAIFHAIASAATGGAAFDAVTIAEALQRDGAEADTAYVFQLAADTASAANVVAYAEIVAEKSRLRKLIGIGTRLAGDAFDARKASRDVLANATHELAQLGDVERGGLQPAKEGLRELFAAMTDRYTNGTRLIGLPTPWHDVNEWTRGLQPRQLYIVAARPGMGKSIFGAQIAVLNALRGANVAWFSVEMSRAECLARAIAAIGDVDYAWVQSPTNNDPDSDLHWASVGRAMEQITKSALMIDDTPALSRLQLAARARRTHMHRKLDLVVVDHMHDMLINPDRARFEYGEIAQTGKTLAKELGCPVVMLAQLNRELEKRANKRPVMSDLRESGELEQKGDVILFLHRDDYYDRTKHRGIVEVICGKSRGLKQLDNPILLRNNFARMRLDDYDGEPIEVGDNAEHVDKSRMRILTGGRAA